MNHTVRSRCAKLPVVVVAQLISSCENMAMKLEPRLPFNGWKSSPRGPAPGGPFGASRPGVRISPACSSSRLSRPSRRVEASHISLTLPWREKPHHYCVRPSSCLISCDGACQKRHHKAVTMTYQRRDCGHAYPRSR